MSWARIDDNFPQHPKILQAGPRAAWLYICGLCYCRKFHTGGFVPAAVVPTLTAAAGGARLVPRLVAAQLWERTTGGYQVHDYTALYADEADKQRAAETADARRRAGRTGGLVSGLVRATNREANEEAKPKQRPKHSEANGEANIEATASSKIEALKDRIGSGSGSDLGYLEGEPEGEPAENPNVFHADEALRQLQEAYPQDRVTYGARTEHAWIAQLGTDPVGISSVILQQLEQQKRSHEWRIKGMIPALEKWLRDGLWQRTLPEGPPAAERPPHAAPPTRGCGHTPPCLTGSDHMQKLLAEARATEEPA